LPGSRGALPTLLIKWLGRVAVDSGLCLVTLASTTRSDAHAVKPGLFMG
jgi:hypothetical protein